MATILTQYRDKDFAVRKPYQDTDRARKESAGIHKLMVAGHT